MRRNTILATLLVILMSAGVGVLVGGGRIEDGPTLPLFATPEIESATPEGTPSELPPFFRIIPNHDTPDW